MRTRILCCLILLPFLGACTSLYTERTLPAPVEEIGGGTPPPVPVGPPAPEVAPDTGVVVSPAILSPRPSRQTTVTPLDSDIGQALAAGEYDRAAALTERALRIRPREAGLWLNLAMIRLEQGRPEEARGHAQRARSFSTDAAQRSEIDRLLAQLETLR